MLGLMVASPHVAPATTPVWIVAAGLLLTLIGLRHVEAGPGLTTIVLAAYGVRVVMTAVLFYVSLWQMPVLDSLRLGAGFWMFSLDSLEYHRVSSLLFRAWSHGTSFPELGPEQGQLFYVALLYRVLGPVPLHVSLLNAWFGSVAIISAVLIVRTFIKDSWTEKAVAVLIGFWPSLVLWSTQMQKDAVTIGLMLLEMHLVIGLLCDRGGRPWAVGARWALAASVPFVLQFTRPYVPLTLAMALVITLAPRAVLGLWRHGAGRQSIRVVAIVAVVLLPTFVASRVQLARALQPAHPEIAHLRLGITHHKAGRLDEAAAEYLNAIAVDNRYGLAIRNLAVAYLQQGMVEEGLRRLERYRAIGPLPSEAQDVEAQIAAVKAFVGGSDWLQIRLAPLDEKARAAVDWRDFGSRFVPRTSALDFVDKVSPARLTSSREGMFREGGSSMVFPEVRLHSLEQIPRFLPRAVIAALWAPFPWEWFDAEHRGGMKPFVSIETFLLYCFIPCIPFAVADVCRRPRLGIWALSLFVLILAGAIGVAVPTLGTLVRVRLQAVVPLFIVFGATGSLVRVRDIAGRIGGIRR